MNSVFFSVNVQLLACWEGFFISGALAGYFFLIILPLPLKVN